MSKRAARWSFRRKLLSLFLAFSLIPLGLVALIVYQTVQTTYRNVLTDAFENTVHLEEQLLRQFVDSQAAFVRSLAAQDIFLGVLEKQVEGDMVSDRDIFVTLVSVRRENLFVEKVYILDTSGDVLISTATDEVGSSNASNRAFSVPRTERRTFVGNTALSSYNKRIIPIATPLIRKSDNTVIGVLVVESNSSVIQSVLESHTRTHYTDRSPINSFAVDHDGLLLTPLPYAPRGTRFETQPVVECREDKRSSSGIWHAHTGERVVGAATCFVYDDLMFTLVTEQEARSAFAIARDLGLIIFIISALVAVLVLLVIVRVSRSITDPIETLRRGTRELGRGNFSYPIKIQTGDEIEELARDFDVARTKLSEVREHEKMLAQKQSDFISIAAHQLRTPLTSIKWALQYLMQSDHTIDAEKRDYLARALHSTNELVIIVNDLLNISRIEEDRFEYEFVEGDIRALTTSAVEQVKELYRDKSVEVTVQPTQTPLPHLAFDHEKLSIAVINVIDNAIKYTPHGGSVTISLTQKTNKISIRVKDTGIGIPARELEHISEKFYRSENARQFHVNGSGLGLFAARKIIEAHNGQLLIESVEGRGTIIEILLPVRANKKIS